MEGARIKVWLAAGLLLAASCGAFAKGWLDYRWDPADAGGKLFDLDYFLFGGGWGFWEWAGLGLLVIAAGLLFAGFRLNSE